MPAPVADLSLSPPPPPGTVCGFALWDHDAAAPAAGMAPLQGFNDEEYKGRRYMLAMRAKQHKM